MRCWPPPPSTSRAYEVPVSVTVVDALPRVASGKVDLAAVREQLDRVSVENDA